MDSWWSQFKSYLAEDKNVTDWRATVEEEEGQGMGSAGNFSLHLSGFLFSKAGSKYKKNFLFSGELLCNSPAPEIKVSYNITVLDFLNTVPCYFHML